MKKYWIYLKYILEHKRNVFKISWNRKLYLHAFTHDLSKFLPKEFFAYARYDFKNKNNNTDKAKEDFKKAWQHHKENNKHHWNHWCLRLDQNTLDYIESEVPREMSDKYLLQMVCDWEAMGLKFGSTAKEYYLSNKNTIKLHNNSRVKLEKILGVYNYSKVEKITSEDIKLVYNKINSIGGYLQGGYGLWILDKDGNEIGNIYDHNSAYLGADIIINTIQIKDEPIISDTLTRLFSGKIINPTENESFW